MPVSPRGFSPAKLKALRSERGWTQQVAAEKMGLERTNYLIYEGEKGAPTPSPAVLRRMAAALEIEARELFDIDEPTLKDLRQLAGITQLACAEAIGYASGASWRSIETGEIPITPGSQTIRTGRYERDYDPEPLATLLGVTVAELELAAQRTAAGGN